MSSHGWLFFMLSLLKFLFCEYCDWFCLCYSKGQATPRNLITWVLLGIFIKYLNIDWRRRFQTEVIKKMSGLHYSWNYTFFFNTYTCFYSQKFDSNGEYFDFIFNFILEILASYSKFHWHLSNLNFVFIYCSFIRHYSLNIFL